MHTKIIFLSLIIVISSSGHLFGQENYKNLVYKGNQKFNSKDYEGASSKYMEAIKSNDKDFTAHYNMGNALYKSKKYVEAKAEYEKAEKLSQTLSDKTAVLHNLGNTHMQMNQPEKAADYYKKALKQDPYSKVTRKNYEIAKLKEKQLQKKAQNNISKGRRRNDPNKGEEQNGDKDKKQDQGNGLQNEGKGEQGDNPKQNQNSEGRVPKSLENAILDKINEKEKETARRILNKESYLAPESNEKDW